MFYFETKPIQSNPTVKLHPPHHPPLKKYPQYYLIRRPKVRSNAQDN